jgi:hypothetical protein
MAMFTILWTRRSMEGETAKAKFPGGCADERLMS